MLKDLLHEFRSYSASEDSYERELKNVINVGRLSRVRCNLVCIREFLLEQFFMNVDCMGMPSATV